MPNIFSGVGKVMPNTGVNPLLEMASNHINIQIN